MLKNILRLTLAGRTGYERDCHITLLLFNLVYAHAVCLLSSCHSVAERQSEHHAGFPRSSLW